MRLENDGTVVLSRRNLKSLLAKVDDPSSWRTLNGGADAPGVTVKAETDADHYNKEFRKHPGQALSTLTMIQDWTTDALHR